MAFPKAVASVVLKQAALWFDSATDEQVLKILAPGLLDLFDMVHLTPERRRRAIRLLETGLHQAKREVDK